LVRKATVAEIDRRAHVAGREQIANFVIGGYSPFWTGVVIVPGIDNIYSSWLYFLSHAEPIIGIPLCAAGAVLVMAGWRLWRATAVLDFALLGGLICYAVQEYQGAGLDWRWIAGSGAVAALVGLFFHRATAPVLGGATGALVVYALANAIGLYGPLLYLLCGAGGVACGAWAFTYRQQVEAVLTSAEGGVLLASGMAIMLPEIPILYKFFSSMTATSPFMIGFYILVPTVVGVTLQQADLNRSLSKTAKA
jgi:hypothetical protein